MEIKKVYDILEYIHNNGTEDLSSFYGFFGYVRKGEIKRVLSEIERVRKRNPESYKSIENVKNWVSEKINEGYNRVYFFATGWEVRY